MRRLSCIALVVAALLPVAAFAQGRGGARAGKKIADRQGWDPTPCLADHAH